MWYAANEEHDRIMDFNLKHRRTNTSLDYYTSLVFTFGNSDNSSQIFNSRYFPTSGSLYLFVVADISTVIAKMYENETIEWSKQFSVIPTPYSFDVSPDESYLCFCQYVPNFIIFIQIDTTNGSVIRTLSTNQDQGDWNNVIMDPSYSSLVISEDSTSIFISAFLLGQTSTHYCRWNQNNFDGKIYCSNNQMERGEDEYNLANSIHPIDFDVSYITLDKNNEHKMEVRKIDYTQEGSYNSWVTQVNWLSQWSSYQNKLLFDFDNDRIYASVSIGQSKIGFFVLHMTNGSQVSRTNSFDFNFSCSASIVISKMHYNENKTRVYIPVQWSSPMLFVYDIDNHIFVDSYIVSGKTFLKSFLSFILFMV